MDKFFSKLAAKTIAGFTSFGFLVDIMANPPSVAMQPLWKFYPTVDTVKKDIVSFYNRAVKDIQRIYQIPIVKIQEAFDSMFQKWEKDIDFHKFEYVIAYTMSYAPSHTDLVRIHTEKFLTYCYTEELTHRDKEFMIVSLGGGPGDDIFGFIHALSRKRGPPKSFKATMVQKEDRFWLIYSEVISQILNANSDLTKYLNISGITPNLIQASVDNCEEENWKKIEEVVKEADVVIMFSSLIRYGEKILEVAERVTDCMKEESLLLLGKQESFSIPDSSSVYENFETVYSSHANACMPRFGTSFGRNMLLSSRGYAEILVKKRKPDSN